MSHKFIPGESLVYIGEKLSYTHTSFEKGQHVEFIDYTQSGGMYVSRYIQGKNIIYIPLQDVPHFTSDWKVREKKIDQLLNL
jgi:hypothetical protein